MDDNNYDDGYDFNGYVITSLKPGDNLLFATFGYTALCLVIGSIFKCRKKKWRNQKQQNIHDDTIAKDEDNTLSTTNGFFCAQDVGGFFEDSSVESDDSSVAYEFMFGPEGILHVGDEQNITGALDEDLPYQLYVDDRNMNPKSTPEHIEDGGNGVVVMVQSNSSTGGSSKTESVEKKVMEDTDIFSSPFVEQNKKCEIEMKDMANKTSSGLDQASENNQNQMNHTMYSVGPDDFDSFGKTVDTSGEGDDTFGNEMKEINALATPWTLSSFIGYFASIVTIALISNFLSVGEMICYSYVWFIVGAVFMLPNALHGSAYKHVNNAIASETEEGCLKAGKYIRISIIINTLLSIPLSFAAVFAMGYILRMYGFDDELVQISSSYTIIAIIHQLTSSTSEFITMTIDIDGYADFNAKFTFFDAIFDICLSFYVIPFLKPSLLQLGLIHYAHEIVSSIIYYYLTWYRWGWFDYYKKGIMTPLKYDRKEKKAFATLVKKTIPMFFDELNSEVEWLITAYFATSLGEVDSASWILLSYIWELIDVIPDNIGSAAEYRVSNQLSKGNIVLAQQVSNRCMVLTALTSVIGSAAMYLFRDSLIKAMVADDDISGMLINAIPYVALCQPLMSIFSIAGYLNQALAMYKRATKIDLLITFLVAVPLSYVSTYHFGWDISGLTAAAFISDATVGAVFLVIYNNADWDKAVRKNRKIAGLVHTSKIEKAEFV